MIKNKIVKTLRRTQSKKRMMWIRAKNAKIAKHSSANTFCP